MKIKCGEWGLFWGVVSVLQSMRMLGHDDAATGYMKAAPVRDQAIIAAMAAAIHEDTTDRRAIETRAELLFLDILDRQVAQ